MIWRLINGTTPSLPRVTAPARSPAQTAQSRSLKSRDAVLFAFVALLQLLHVVVVSVHAHVWVSDLLQVLVYGTAMLICGMRAHSASAAYQRRFWTALCVALAIWNVGEFCYLAERSFLDARSPFWAADDFIWLAYAIPLFFYLAFSSPGERRGWVGWLDVAQLGLFLLGLYALVYAPPRTLPFRSAYDLQNAALCFSWLIRYGLSTTVSERALLRTLGIYLFVYGVCSAFGNSMQANGWAAGSIVDLCWTAPVSLLCLLALHSGGSLRFESDFLERSKAPFAQHLYGLAALGLATFSFVTAALLVLRTYRFGIGMFAACFIVFAMRTSAREDQLFRTQSKLEGMVLQDPLTGLGNRLKLHRRLEDLRETAVSSLRCWNIALLFIDLDLFKPINDKYGHVIGDQVLVEVGVRIRDNLRSGDTVCRIGGDEFVALTDGIEGLTLTALAERIRTAISEPMYVSDNYFGVSASVGVLFADASRSAEELLSEADRAMYNAKANGRNQVFLLNTS